MRSLRLIGRLVATPTLAFVCGLLANGLAGCGALQSPGDAPPAATVPLVAERPAPPAPHSVSLENVAPVDATALEASLTDQVARLSKLTPEAESALRDASFDGGAPSSLVVLAGGRQADVTRPPRARHERWELRFASGTSVETYARQLDFFKIELGIIGGQEQVAYLTNLSNPKPTSRTGNAADDRRLYLIWQRGAISEVDEQIAARAGVKTDGKVIAHFLPKEVEDEMARLEESYARQLKMTKIGKSVFSITSSGQDNYKLSVDLKAESL